MVPPAPEDSLPLLRVEDLHVHFPVHDRLQQREIGTVRAVDGVSFDIERGETLGLVGETGSGKSTLARAVLQLQRPNAGRVLFHGEDLTQLRGEALRRKRQQFQMIFQDPWGSLDPRMTIGDIVAEPFRIHGLAKGRELREKVSDLLVMCGLSERDAHKFPHEFSGGQRQRVGIARALALRPELVVADEPLSALDVSIQSQILNLLLDLQEQLGLQYLFISHDLQVVRYVSTHVAVMYLGKIVERTDRDSIFEEPLHPYSQALLSAALEVDPTVGATADEAMTVTLRGDLPSALNLPSGCRYRTRCPIAVELCAQVEPPLEEKRPGHRVACHKVPVLPDVRAGALPVV